ncbi:MAG: aminopeptidase P family protein, partial [Bacteroidetes bacterium]
MTVNERIAALRRQMELYGYDAWIIPSSDPHQSEYVAAHWKAREWISGFTGSAGTVIVTRRHVGLWTDSRYFLQAEQQLAGTEVVLHKQRVPHAPEHVEWLANNLPEHARVGCNGWLFSVGQIGMLQQALSRRHISLDTTRDLVADIWTDRPPLPAEPVFAHDVQYAGRTRGQKLEAVRQRMAELGADHYLITTLDDIAWLYNLRGSDVPCNPVFYAWALVSRDDAHLFVGEAKVPAELRQALKADGIWLHPYEAITDILEHLPDGKVLLDKATLNYRLWELIPEAMRLPGEHIARQMKAVKNEVEIAHMRQVMVRDGVALVKLFMWLERTITERPVPETEVAERLIELRRARGNYWGESFDAIVGYQANGAIVHYRAEPDTCAHIRPQGILLLDCGGQYYDGTTDITRTVALGAPTPQQKRHFTLVLKGHIALARARFPEGTTGAQLDTLARMYLWQDLLNYGHGTGHGVGFFLNVHEPPQGFATSPVTSRGRTAFVPGMITSNEPGLYLTDQYGIRIENLVLCREAGRSEFGAFLEHETLTLFPIDRQLIEPSMLTPEERQWLDDYHQM